MKKMLMRKRMIVLKFSHLNGNSRPIKGRKKEGKQIKMKANKPILSNDSCWRLIQEKSDWGDKLERKRMKKEKEKLNNKGGKQRKKVWKSIDGKLIFNDASAVRSRRRQFLAEKRLFLANSTLDGDGEGGRGRGGSDFILNSLYI